MVCTQKMIAIVDDEPSVCRALGRLVRTEGLRAELFAAGQEFLARLEQDESFQPDCVLLDIHMPGMSGLEVQRLLRQAGRSLPVVFVTAHEGADQWRRAMAADGVSVLQKPVTADVLFRAIQDAGVSWPDASSADGASR